MQVFYRTHGYEIDVTNGRARVGEAVSLCFRGQCCHHDDSIYVAQQWSISPLHKTTPDGSVSPPLRPHDIVIVFGMVVQTGTPTSTPMCVNQSPSAPVVAELGTVIRCSFTRAVNWLDFTSSFYRNFFFLAIGEVI